MKIVMEKIAGFFRRSPLGSLFFLIFILIAAANLAAQGGYAQNERAQDERAQDGERARIGKLEGKDFTLTMDGIQTVIPAEMVMREGVYLERSGVVHTGAGTFLEIQLIPSGTVIKLAENTSFIYNGIDETGKFVDVGLLYGRILVVTGSSLNSGGIRSLAVRSGGVSTRIENADIGVDYLLEPGGGTSSLRPLCRVYAFRGGAEIFPYGRGGAPAYFGDAESLSLQTMECISLDISSPFTFAERTSMERNLFDFWMLSYSAYSPFSPMPNTAAVQALPETPGSAVSQSASSPLVVREVERIYIPIDPANSGERRPATLNNRSKNLCLAIGLALTAGSAATQCVFHYLYDNYGNSRDRDIYYIAYAGLSTGLIITLSGILYNPSSTGKRN